MIEHKRRNSPGRPFVILSGCVGTVVGLTYAMTSNTGVIGPFRMMAPYPVEIAELVTPASLIVKGELGDIVQQTTFAGYDDAGDIIPVMTITNQSPPSLGTPTTTVVSAQLWPGDGDSGKGWRALGGHDANATRQG